MNNKLIRDINLIVCCGLIFFSSQALADLEFEGNLLDRPCQIDPVSSSQNIEFRSTPVQQFNNSPGRGTDSTFTIKLSNCRTDSFYKTVKVNFTGNTESNLPGALMVSGVNSGKLAIQLIDARSGTLIDLDKPENGGAATAIQNDSVVLNYNAFVQATPTALEKKSVEPGEFQATVTFQVVYI